MITSLFYKESPMTGIAAGHRVFAILGEIER